MGISLQPAHAGSPWEKGTVETSFCKADQRIHAGLQQLGRLTHGDIGRRRRDKLGYSPPQPRNDARHNVGFLRRAQIGKIEQC